MIFWSATRYSSLHRAICRRLAIQYQRDLETQQNSADGRDCQREKSRAVFVELQAAENGDYYTVRSAFPVGHEYAEAKAKSEGWIKLWSREPVPAVGAL
jgi:hypothetical protein